MHGHEDVRVRVAVVAEDQGSLSCLSMWTLLVLFTIFGDGSCDCDLPAGRRWKYHSLQTRGLG